MKAQKYLEELIDQEQDYLLGYDEGEKPQQHIDRLKDLKEALTEVKNCSIPDVVGQGEQLCQCKMPSPSMSDKCSRCNKVVPNE